MKLTTKPSVKLEKTIDYDLKVIEKIGGTIKEFRNYEDKFCCIIYEKFIKNANAVKPILRYYIGTSLKPKEYYYPNIVRVEEKIISELKLIQEREAYKKERSLQKKNLEAKNIELFKVGDLFYTSTGYSMTLVNFYEIVSKKGSFVSVRPINYKVTDGSDGWSGYKKPIRGSFAGDEIRCKVTRWGISVDSQSAYLTSEDSEIYFNHMD